MRPTKCQHLLCKCLIGLAGAAALVPAAWAYVNGGDFRSTLRDFEKDLKAKGWAVSIAAPLPAGWEVTGKVEKGVKVSPADKDYRHYLGQLVGRALQALPEKDAAGVTAETRRELARRAGEVIADVVGSTGKPQTKEGQAGPLEYQVGVVGYESYWETNYHHKREIHERRTGLVPFVAVRVRDARDPPK
jgi:hypothetical protein